MTTHSGPTAFAAGEARSSTLAITSARLSLVTGVATLLLLFSLHFLSPEFDPSWRMVSEYALGEHAWVLSLFFVCWAISSWSLVVALWPHVKGLVGAIGLLLLAVSGLGEAMAAVFDANHRLHGLAAALGVPTLPIAAVLTSICLGRTHPWAMERKKLLWMANLTWVSLVLMAVAMVVMMSGFAQAGFADAGTYPISVPAGVIALAGWTNRLLVAAYCLWLIATARITIRALRESALSA